MFESTGFAKDERCDERASLTVKGSLKLADHARDRSPGRFACVQQFGLRLGAPEQLR
jgi:hypothetical protein